MATINNVLNLRHVSYSYNGFTVLDDISFEIPRKKFTILMGQNGSGKSTLLRIIGGLLPYHTGSVMINGEELKDMTPRERAKLVGFLPQRHKAVFPFSVEEVVLTGRAAYISYLPDRNDRLEADKAISLCGIQHLKNRYYTELSGGEQQLVMIARALAQHPEILLLDEPISHLDYSNQLRIIRLIKQLVDEGITVLAVLHDPNMAFLFGDYFVFVHEHHVHPVVGCKAWEHVLIPDIFHNDLTTMEYEGKNFFIPRLKWK
jgi:iron complex transport system ATP-binding protein